MSQNRHTPTTEVCEVLHGRLGGVCACRAPERWLLIRLRHELVGDLVRLYSLNANRYVTRSLCADRDEAFPDSRSLLGLRLNRSWNLALSGRFLRDLFAMLVVTLLTDVHCQRQRRGCCAVGRSHIG